jgi:excinuclease ABC subunit C
VLAGGGPLPDLMVIDGGKGQLGSALEVIAELGIRSAEEPNSAAAGGGRPAVIGLAKRLEEIYHPGVQDPQSIPKSSPGLKLLQRIRNEAHRFAVSHHRSRRSRRTLRTELDLIAGVGKKRANLLLGAFGSVQGVRFATTEQIAEIVGEATALKISHYFENSVEAGPGE